MSFITFKHICILLHNLIECMIKWKTMLKNIFYQIICISFVNVGSVLHKIERYMIKFIDQFCSEHMLPQWYRYKALRSDSRKHKHGARETKQQKPHDIHSSLT